MKPRRDDILIEKKITQTDYKVPLSQRLKGGTTYFLNFEFRIKFECINF